MWQTRKGLTYRIVYVPDGELAETISLYLFLSVFVSLLCFDA
jgi:hypothetical protein